MRLSSVPALALPLVAAAFALMCLPTPAHAGGKAKAEPGTSRSPKLFLDEPESLFEVRNSDSGFAARASGRMSGFSGTSDLLHLELRHKGKLLEKIPCDYSFYNTEAQFAEFVCTGKQDFKLAGPIEGLLFYWDDAAEKSYLVRTFTATVHEASFNGVAKWVGTPDDLLGAAYVRHIPANGNRGLELMFHFWTSGEARGQKFRCTVDGKKLPDLEGSPRTGAIVSDELELDQQVNGQRQTVKWTRHRVVLSDVVHGDKATAIQVLLGNADTFDQHHVSLVDHPGQWVCDVRANGAAGRRFAFTVTPEGKVARHPSQDAEGALPSWRNVSQLAVTIPADAPFDQRVRPDELKKSMGFGLPWPKDSAELTAGIPSKKKGTVEPKRGKK
ncbi:MAG: hypothetical protein IPI49_13145 [Myxococcales bacterium]|nr:hypothetical protein [Myxococcales bacterium]